MEGRHDLIKILYEKNVLWFVLGSLISADSYMFSNEEGIKNRKNSIAAFDLFLREAEITNVSEQIKNEVIRLSLQGKELLENEIKELENTPVAQ